MQATATYSSRDLRERDQILQEKHLEELAAAERRLEKLKWSNEDLLRQLFDAQLRGNRLARSIGFEDVNEAQVFVSGLEHEISYKESILEAGSLRKEVEERKLANERLRDELLAIKKMAEELEITLNASIESKKSAEDEVATLMLELSRLQKQYDMLADVKKRAAERYKTDYKKWRDFKEWLINGEPKVKTNELKRKKLAELDARDTPHFVDCEPSNTAQSFATHPTCDKENQPIIMSHTGMEHNRHSIAESAKSMPFVPKINAQATPTPSLRRQGALPTTSAKDDVRNTRRNLVPGSSDTEEDTQAPDVFPSPFPLFKIPGLPPRYSQTPAAGSSDAEDDHQTPDTLNLIPASVNMCVPPVTGTSPVSVRVVRPAEVKRHTATPLAEQSPLLPRPSKVQRQSDHDVAEHISPSRVPQDTESPIKTDVTWLGNRRYEDRTPLSGRKGAEKVNCNSAPAGLHLSKNRVDYSTYKGRGRYAKLSGEPKTINAVFEIDPQRNGGKNYQYEEVVRSKETRRKLDAGDCECCRQYYEAIGPLPKRLQQPLWQSPPSTPVKPCPRHRQLEPSNTGQPERDDLTQDIRSHQHAISRHRYQWARARTPPGYWNIGFPTTQEADEINQQAEEMHRQKREAIAAEARRSDGRYKNR